MPPRRAAHSETMGQTFCLLRRFGIQLLVQDLKAMLGK
jgi:hypothetical protein